MPRELEDQQRVLSEASHDLANRFHRSYYFLDLLGDAVEGAGAEAAEQLQRLRDTIEDIESIARQTLQFFRPVELRPIRVRLEDLLASLRQHAGPRGLATGGDAEAGRVEVAVDPTRISEVLAAMCLAVADGDDGPAPLQAQFLGGELPGLRLTREGAASSTPPPDLPLAVAARVVREHGGSLAWDESPDGAPSLTLRLPVATPGT